MLQSPSRRTCVRSYAIRCSFLSLYLPGRYFLKGQTNLSTLANICVQKSKQLFLTSGMS